MYIDDESEYNFILRCFDCCTAGGSNFPEFVFSDDFKFFFFMDFDYALSISFVSSIFPLLKSEGEESLYFSVLEPDPENYFFYNFSKYPLVKIDLDVAKSGFDIAEAIELDPGGSPSDAIAYNANELWVFPASLEWAIFMSRDFELAILGCKKDEVKKEFSKIIPEARFRSLREICSDRLFDFQYDSELNGLFLKFWKER